MTYAWWVSLFVMLSSTQHLPALFETVVVRGHGVLDVLLNLIQHLPALFETVVMHGHGDPELNSG